MTESIEFGPAKRARVEWDAGRGCVRYRDANAPRNGAQYRGGKLPRSWPPESHAPARELWERCRPLAEDEILPKGKRRKMRMSKPGEKYPYETTTGPEDGETALVVDHGGDGLAAYTREELLRLAREYPDPDSWPCALAYFDRHAPKPPGPINDGAGWRFENGEEIEFRMRDDGEAECGAYYAIVILATTPEGFPCNGLGRALYAFRDRERAQWTFEVDGEVVWVTDPSRGIGGLSHGSRQGEYFASFPTWVREKAHKMWEERREPPKPLADNVRKACGIDWRFQVSGEGRLRYAAVNGQPSGLVSALPVADPVRLAAEEWHREQDPGPLSGEELHRIYCDHDGDQLDSLVAVHDAAAARHEERRKGGWVE